MSRHSGRLKVARCGVALALMVAIGSLTGCGGGDPARSARRGRDETFLAVGPNQIRAVQWTRNGGRLQGALTLEEVASSDPFHEQVRTIEFAGVEHGQLLSLRPTALAAVWTGERHGPTLTLRYQLADGRPSVVSLTLSTQRAFDDASQALAVQVGAAQARVADATAQAAGAQRLAAEQAQAAAKQAAAAARARKQAEAQARAEAARISAAKAAAVRSARPHK